MKYIKTYEQFLNENKESIDEAKHYIEVAVRDARKANDHLHDMHRGQYKTDGSNYYIFKKEDDAYDALTHLKDMNVEILDTNIDITEGTYHSDIEVATYDDPSGDDGETRVEKRGTSYYAYNDNFDFTAKSKMEMKEKLKKYGYKLTSGKL